MVSAPAPLDGMTDHTCAHHIQIDVLHAIPKMIATFNHGAMKAPAPKSAAAQPAAVVIEGKLTFKLLHETTDRPGLARGHQQVDMVAGNGVIQERNPELLGGDSQSLTVRLPVHCKSKQKRAVVATVGEVVKVSREDVAVGTWHRNGSKKGKTVRFREWRPEIDVRPISSLIKEPIRKMVNDFFRSDPNPQT